MFGLFRSNPIKKLRKQYDIALQDAMKAQRHGDIRLYAELSTEANKIYQKIKRFEEDNA